ncbi:hypothetical protein OAS16_06710, partial [Candidatus Pelagibacter sp.]|nr:hypothetical protein [Candidatus Pelagibacter sp.]
MLIKLNKILYDKIKKYKESFQFGKHNENKSKYWANQVDNIKIHFRDPSEILLSGKSGVYLPKNKKIINLIK